VATVTKAANAHTVVATGWTNPANCYATTNDSTYATIISAKNATYSGDFGFPAFTTGDIPDGSTINSVTVYTTYGVTVATTGMLVGIQCRRNTGGVTLGSEITTAAASMADANVVATGATLTDLRTANEFRARARVTKGSTSTASTGNIDRLYVTVDYTAGVQNAVATAADSVASLTEAPVRGVMAKARAVADGISGGASYDDTILAESSLVSYWQLGEAAGTNAADAQDGNAGTYSGAYTLNQTGLLTGDPGSAVAFTTGTCMLGSTTGFPSGAAVRSLEYWFKSSDQVSTWRSAFQYGPAVADQKFVVGYHNYSTIGPIWVSTAGPTSSTAAGTRTGPFTMSSPSSSRPRRSGSTLIT
jgi:hypothetical protein